jgi:citrate lyase subunit beta / citryl-CoA lyase
MADLNTSPATGPASVARTLLFVPGIRPERFAKAAETPADLVIADLEDAVPEKDKTTARAAVARWLFADGRAAVRVNGAKSVHHQQDVTALAGLPGLLAVVVPMADDAAALAALHQRLGPDVEVVVLIETALGLVRAVELASAPGVSRLAFGNLDFAADIDSSTEDDALLLARSSLVVASRAAGLPGPVDGVTTDLDDPAVAGADATRARGLGFTGKLCIHPKQLAAVNAAFTPGPDEIAWASRIIEASPAGDAVRVDGHMVDAPVILKARAVLARAREST